MVNVMIYLVAAIGVAVQTYSALHNGLSWAPGGSLPMVGFVGMIIMVLGTAWSAIKGSSAAWIVFIGALCCWAFYIPALGNLFGFIQATIAEGRFSFANSETYTRLLPAVLLGVATITSLMAGPLGKTDN
jgi:hypothetical protein